MAEKLLAVQTKTADSIWRLFAAQIEGHLTDDDDPRLWQAAIETIVADATFLCDRHVGKEHLFAEVGRCSHWLSPHNKGSWFSYARFAWPSGYGGSGWSISGLPEFDWSLIWKWTRNVGWEPVERLDGKRRLVLRVAVPARTARHVRAVVHTQWSPGTPTLPKEKLVKAYGFQKSEDVWRFIAASGRNSETDYDS
jgi:hypothetical protein